MTFEFNVHENDLDISSLQEKPLLIPIKIPLMEEKKPQASQYEKKQPFFRKKYEKLVKNLTFRNMDEDENTSCFKFNYFGIMPFLFFFKFLAKANVKDEVKECLQLNIPDTIIINEQDYPPIWLYTSKSGYIHKTENFVLKDILEKFGIMENPDELVAVLKRPRFEEQNVIGNDLKLYSTRDLNLWCNGFLLGRRGGFFKK